jgi:hypothetical protein
MYPERIVNRKRDRAKYIEFFKDLRYFNRDPLAES